MSWHITTKDFLSFFTRNVTKLKKIITSLPFPFLLNIFSYYAKNDFQITLRNVNEDR